MNKLKQLTQWCKAHDTYAHLIVSFILAQLFLVLLPFFSLEVAFGISTLSCFSIFIGKEIYDKYKKNPTGFSQYDLFMDFIGWLLGSVFASIILILILIFK